MCDQNWLELNFLKIRNVTLDNLSYLAVEQILADIAIFVQTARRHLNNYEGQVFVWGSGIGGTLAILARQKYPAIINGAWSSNGIFLPTVFTTRNIICRVDCLANQR